MVAAAVINFVQPGMKIAISGMESRNKNEGRKFTSVQIACVVFGVLNIILSTFVIISCFIVVGTGNSIFAKWMTPWHSWTNNETLHVPRLSELNENDGYKRYDLNSIIAIMLAIFGPYIMISKFFLFLGMSVVLISGINKRSASTLKAFLIYAAVVLPMCIIVNIFYLVMIGLHGVTDYDSIIPHVAVLFFNLVFALEMFLVCITYNQLKLLAPYSPTRLSENEY